ncbi:MAG: urea transport system ATP-binding protein [Cycloclasticus pugetii]|jgi:urea transport system ATP-binding protein|uniref:Urea ABC transporter ATPase UrtE n=1 Tax=Cycloclasticus pugetii TaxID=34068 RepID=A0AB33Z1H4_9GAMM|nr:MULTISPECIES: urea ABC transporter ATP-binding subunit UrtE [Cycloclasticus]AFT66051.1 Urea ABC transporter ATPase protein UrtE [Cycloclasticus sp. P1]ATI02171.1 urea ABC transporter ATP-binding subunit UrtE [Cycloclasticus sp. PY97N]EPD13075.1 urea ABC transporter ATPase UrtE [Cycloclasticus pugetii]MDF1829503.1 urea ABC transporter ATP-binding subunit UrtE [Cycloclasticus pugetii]PHR50206.1 MAG: urea ABC transporter ATP-binding subunit UrtE [Cycloclasticus sp.]|tara:strand:- start:897 stop:1592 length:696 start_codon:yes stop_codon:yes gene_type:complete
MLKIEKLNQFYGQSHTLWDLDIEIPKGKCTCLMGRNGVGKTTLVQSVMGILPTKSGSMMFDGQELSKLSAEKRASLGIGYVPQGRQVFPLLTVEENLKIGLSSRRDKVRTIPESIYEMFPVLKEMSQRRGGDLSGGQQQQLAIGRALALDPVMLILDEPTEGIQPNIVQEIGDIINKLNKEAGLTVLLVEQKLPITKKVADQFIIMERGCAVAKGEIAELTDDLVSEYLTV